MMKRPIVAIIGRPNVGKSTLFNRLVGRRAAIARSEPGVTRDRHYMECTYRDRQFTLVDTGGLLPGSSEPLPSLVSDQTQRALSEADYLFFLMDGREGLTVDDEKLIDWMRPLPTPIFYVVNKIDGPRAMGRICDFYQIGADRLFPISAEHGDGIDDLMEELYPLLPPSETVTPPSIPRIIVMGRPNVGKSTLINTLVGEERVITSEIPGTTRDPIDTWVEWNEKRYCVVDTAGIKRPGRIGDDVARACVARAFAHLTRSDIALLLLDGKEGVVQQDTKIAGRIIEEGKGIVLVVNKWDLVPEGSEQEAYREIARRFPFLPSPPVLCVSALRKEGIPEIFRAIDRVMEAYSLRLPQADLTQSLHKFLVSHPPPPCRGRPVYLSSLTQVGTRPPTFSLFVNYPDGLSVNYHRYLENRLREEFQFFGVPLRFRVVRKVGRKRGKRRGREFYFFRERG